MEEGGRSRTKRLGRQNGRDRTTDVLFLKKKKRGGGGVGVGEEKQLCLLC